MSGWNPWIGCYAACDGCKYCYIYGQYSKRHGQNNVVRTDEFYVPLDKQMIESGNTVYTCFSSDFFIKEADEWRVEAWSIIKQRPDLTFRFLTKRIDRFLVSLPDDWGDGYDNVRIGCGVEDQEAADHRLPLYISYPIKHRWIICRPLLGKIDLTPYLHGVEEVTAHGESGRDARVCDYDWILDIRNQCRTAGISFRFEGTGSRFRQDGVIRKINPYIQKRTAREMNININCE
jgi:protein gp37